MIAKALAAQLATFQAKFDELEEEVNAQHEKSFDEVKVTSDKTVKPLADRLSAMDKTVADAADAVRYTTAFCRERYALCAVQFCRPPPPPGVPVMCWCSLAARGCNCEQRATFFWGAPFPPPRGGGGVRRCAHKACLCNGFANN